MSFTQKSKSLSRVWLFVTAWTVACKALLQARILEWVAVPFSRGSSQTRDWTQVFCTAGGFFYCLSHQESSRILEWVAYPFSRGSSRPRTWTGVSCSASGFFTTWAPRKALLYAYLTLNITATLCGCSTYCYHFQYSRCTVWYITCIITCTLHYIKNDDIC